MNPHQSGVEHQISAVAVPDQVSKHLLPYARPGRFDMSRLPAPGKAHAAFVVTGEDRIPAIEGYGAEVQVQGRDSLSCPLLILIILERIGNNRRDSVCHAPNGCTFRSPGPAAGGPCAAGRCNPVRGLCRARGRGGRDRVRPGAAWLWSGARALASGSAGTAGDGAPLSGRAWAAKTPDGDAAFPPGRCDDRGRGGIALPGAGCGHRRNPGQSGSGELYGDEAAGLAGRSLGRALLADPAGGECRSERGARSLADCHAALCRQSRRSARARRSVLAGGAVPVARRAAGGMGGAS